MSGLGHAVWHRQCPRQGVSVRGGPSGSSVASDAAGSRWLNSLSSRSTTPSRLGLWDWCAISPPNGETTCTRAAKKMNIAARTGGKKREKPIASVTKPGVNSRIPATISRAPSPMARAGTRPSAMSLRRRLSVARPCHLSRNVPTIAVNNMQPRVAQSPICCPSRMKTLISRIGTTRRRNGMNAMGTVASDERWCVWHLMCLASEMSAMRLHNKSQGESGGPKGTLDPPRRTCVTTVV